MDFNEYAEKYCNITIDNKTKRKQREEIIVSLEGKINEIMLEKYKKGELIISDNISGHKFNSELEMLNSKNLNKKELLRILNVISNSIASIIERQAKSIDTMNGIVSDDDLIKIDINDVFNGNLKWEIGGIFNPEMLGYKCQNDGKQYVLIMDNWELNLIDQKAFIMEDRIERIKPFRYDNAPIETQIEFKTNELVVFNFLPKEISTFIEKHFSKSTYEYEGRDWQKNLNEIYGCFDIYRTSAYCGGTVFQDDNYVILGKCNSERQPSSKIGATISAVWQTLIAEKEDVIKLVMMALNKNRDEAEDFFSEEFIKRQDAVLTIIEPGKYYSYTVPSLDSDNYEKVYKDIKMKGVKSVSIDMLISKNKIKTTKELDTVQILPKNDIEKAKQVFNDFNETQSLKM